MKITDLWNRLDLVARGAILGLLVGLIGFFMPPGYFKWMLFLPAFPIFLAAKYLPWLKMIIDGSSAYLFLPINLLFYMMMGCIVGFARKKGGRDKMMVAIEIILISSIIVILICVFFLKKSIEFI